MSAEEIDDRDAAAQQSHNASLAEAVIADVAAAIVAEVSVGAQPDDASRRRLRRAARAVFEAVADESAIANVEPRGAESSVAEQLPPHSAFVADEQNCVVDEFAFAARLFAFTGETPIQRAAVDDSIADAAEPAETLSVPHVAPRRSRVRASAIAKRMVAASFSVAVMGMVGLLAVGTTTPAEAVAAVSNTSADITVAASPAKVATEDIQAFVASGDVAAGALNRSETYDVTSMAQIAADSGVTQFAGTWLNDPNAAIQWPFSVGVPISAAYGSNTYLSQFSSPHRGVDLTPGAGAEVHVVAAGTVRIATEAGGDYGVTVVVDHVIDGELVSTRYAHMQYGSLTVAVGDTVTAGQVLGKVGQTGKATGPHLHFEVLLGGSTYTDPMAWMYEHTAS